MLAWRLEKLEVGLEEIWAESEVHKQIMKLDGLVQIVAIPFGCPPENTAYGRMTIDWEILLTQWMDYNSLRYEDSVAPKQFDGLIQTYESILQDLSKVSKQDSVKLREQLERFKEDYSKQRPEKVDSLLEAEVLGKLLDGFGRKNIMPFGRWMINFSFKDKHVSANKVFVIQSTTGKSEGGIQPFYRSKYGEKSGEAGK